MFCIKCGKELPEGSEFCNGCGTKLEVMGTAVSAQVSDTRKGGETPTSNSDSASAAAGASIPTTAAHFEFYKAKQMARLTYRTTQTVVDDIGDILHIEMKTKRMFHKEETGTWKIERSEIAQITLKTALDFWDLLYGILFAVLGFFQPILFVLSVICLFCAYGKELELVTVTGVKVKIPTKSNANAEELIAYLKNAGG